MHVQPTRRFALKLFSAAFAALGLIVPAIAQDFVDKITWGMSSVPETLFIPNAWSTGNGVIMSLVQEGPLAFGDDLSLIDGVAAQAFPDPTTVVYTLRDDVTFSDGSPLTPEDIVATYAFQRDHPNNGSQVGFFFDPIASVEATGDHEVTVKLKNPNVQFQYAAAHMAGFIFKKEQIEGDRTDLGGADLFIVGTGPYKIAEFDPGERVLLEAREDYWNGAPKVKQIEFVRIPDAEAQLLAMQAGQIDGFFNVQMASIDQWEALPNADVYEAPSASTMLLTLNYETPPFNDVHVRRAIAHSVDREGLLNAVLKGKGEVLQAINPPEMWAGVMSADEARAFYATIPTYEFDLEKAKAELAQSSVPNGFEFTVPVANNSTDAINVLQNLAQNLATIGVTLTLEQVDPNQWLTQFFESGAPMQLMTYWPDFADPVNYPDLFMHSRNARENGQNQSYYRNAKVDELLDLANREFDSAKRKDALMEAFKIVNEEVAVVPIYTPYSAMALNSELEMTGYNAFWYNIPWAVRGFGTQELVIDGWGRGLARGPVFLPSRRPMTAAFDAFDRLNRLKSISDLRFTPDGAALVATIRPALSEGDDGPKPHIWLFGLDGKATQLTHGPSGEGNPRYAPAGDALAFLSDRGSKGKTSLFLIEPGQEARRLGDLSGAVEDYRWTADGQAIVAQVADKGVNGGAATGAMRLWWGDDQDPEVTTPSHAKRRLFWIDRNTGAARECGPVEENVWEFDLSGPDTAVAVVSPDPSERGWHHARLARVELSTRATTILHTPEWQIQGLCAEPGGSRVAFTEGWSSDRGLVVGEIKVIDLGTGAITAVANDELSNVTDLHWLSGEQLAFAGWDKLGSIYGVVGLEGQIVWQEREDAVVGDSAFVARVTPAPDGSGLAVIRETVGHPAESSHRPARGAPWVQVSSLNGEVARDFQHYPEIRPVSWQGKDGLHLKGVLVLPSDRPPGPLPAIVDIHGGPCYTSKPQFNPSGAVILAAHGYAVFLPNYRGNVGWGQSFTKLDVGDPAGAEFEDILAGIDHCVAAGFIDSERLGVTGGSYGGYMTAWAVATTHRFKAAVMVSGIANQISCHYSCEHAFHEFVNGGPLTDPKNFAMAVDRSPIYRLNNPTTPTLMIHGREDRCTPLGQAQEFYAALLERGVEAELVVYPGEGHGIRKPKHRRDFLERKLAWFDRYLRPERAREMPGTTTAANADTPPGDATGYDKVAGALA